MALVSMAPFEKYEDRRARKTRATPTMWLLERVYSIPQGYTAYTPLPERGDAVVISLDQTDTNIPAYSNPPSIKIQTPRVYDIPTQQDTEQGATKIAITYYVVKLWPGTTNELLDSRIESNDGKTNHAEGHFVSLDGSTGVPPRGTQYTNLSGSIETGNFGRVCISNPAEFNTICPGMWYHVLRYAAGVPELGWNVGTNFGFSPVKYATSILSNQGTNPLIPQWKGQFSWIGPKSNAINFMQAMKGTPYPGMPNLTPGFPICNGCTIVVNDAFQRDDQVIINTEYGTLFPPGRAVLQVWSRQLPIRRVPTDINGNPVEGDDQYGNTWSVVKGDNYDGGSFGFSMKLSTAYYVNRFSLADLQPMEWHVNEQDLQLGSWGTCMAHSLLCTKIDGLNTAGNSIITTDFYLSWAGYDSYGNPQTWDNYCQSQVGTWLTTYQQRYNINLTQDTGHKQTVSKFFPGVQVDSTGAPTASQGPQQRIIFAPTDFSAVLGGLQVWWNTIP